MLESHDCVVPWIMSNKTICTNKGSTFQDNVFILQPLILSLHRCSQCHFLDCLEQGDKPVQWLLQNMQGSKNYCGWAQHEYGRTMWMILMNFNFMWHHFRRKTTRDALTSTLRSEFWWAKRITFTLASHCWLRLVDTLGCYLGYPSWILLLGLLC